MLTPIASASANRISIGVPVDDEAETTGSSISGVAIEPALNDIAANENTAANSTFFIFFSNFNHVTWLYAMGL